MSEPERWTDEWIVQLWLERPESGGPYTNVLRFARAVAKEAMQEAASLVWNHAAPMQSERKTLRKRVADKIRARAKEISG